MEIHNLLSDYLVSIKILLDQHIFGFKPGFIKHYEFNMGNRAFQLGQKPNVNYELPSAIVNILDEDIYFGGRRTDLIKPNQNMNINKIPVLHNETQQVTLYLHEEHVRIPFSISINCESQLQAKEVSYQIRRILPLNKNINIFSFISFLELPLNILINSLKFNLLNDVIDNLYTKLNYNTNNIDYCYSIQYNPLIRLDSSTVSISDSTQSTFQTQLELSYLIPLPHSLVVNEYYLVELINFSFNTFNHPIVVQPFTKISGLPNPTYHIYRTLLIDNEDYYISKTDTQAYLSIHFNPQDFLITEDYKFRFRKYPNYYLNVTPTYFYTSENKVVFIFPVTDYNTYIKPELTSPTFVDFYKDV